MTVKFEKSLAKGCVLAPPSKSMSHRYLICGAFTKKSIIKGIAFSDDIKATLDCLSALGANVEINGNDVSIGGLNFNNCKNNVLFCNESGSTLRFLIPVALLFNQEIKFTGSKRLFERSLEVYEEICKEQNIDFNIDDNSITLNGKLSSGNYTVRGDISSQFISGLMFALVNLKEDSTINLTGNIESRSYIDLTIKSLSDFGIKIDIIDDRTFYIKGNQKLQNREITVEGDYSNSAFLDAFNLFGGNVVVEGLSDDSVQGDRKYQEYFKLLCDEASTVDITDCPDLAPILMAVAAVKNGANFIGTKRLKIKESDRGKAMQSELSKFGCETIVLENEIIVKKSCLTTPKTCLNGHNDHRIVMALSVLLTVFGGSIDGAEAVKKSYPVFFETLKSLGLILKEE